MKLVTVPAHSTSMTRMRTSLLSQAGAVSARFVTDIILLDPWDFHRSSLNCTIPGKHAYHATTHTILCFLMRRKSAARAIVTSPTLKSCRTTLPLNAGHVMWYLMTIS